MAMGGYCELHVFFFALKYFNPLRYFRNVYLPLIFGKMKPPAPYLSRDICKGKIGWVV